MLVRNNTRLMEKVKLYIKWRYNDTRSVCVATLDKGCRIRVITRCHERDHYPERLRNAYRRCTVHSEYVNQYQMNDLYVRNPLTK